MEPMELTLEAHPKPVGPVDRASLPGRTPDDTSDADEIARAEDAAVSEGWFVSRPALHCPAPER